MIRLAVPPSHMEAVMQAHHDNLLGGHLGKRCTRLTISHKYWWPKMATQINAWVTSCKQCQQKKNPQCGKNGLLELIPGATRPFKQVGMDLMGPFWETDNGH